MDTIKKKPGRPRIEDSPTATAAPAAQAAAPKAEPKPAEKSALTNRAYSIVKLGNKWMLVKIHYNPLTGQSSAPEMSVIGPNTMEAQERFRIAVANDLFK